MTQFDPTALVALAEARVHLPAGARGEMDAGFRQDDSGISR
jgi:hypothetical protein